jgi:Bacterial PH domain
MSSSYKASLDVPAKIITGLILLMCLFFAIMGVITAALILFVTIALCYLLHPTAYTLNKDVLIIQRPVKPVVIHRNEIASVELLTDRQLKWTIRTFGVGGLFGYFGYFYNREIGSMLWYTSHQKNRILITTKNEEKIVISPDDPSLFESLKWRNRAEDTSEE